jgi:hypothetical protein
MIFKHCLPPLLCSSFLIVCCAYGQDDEAATGVRRPSIGVRFDYFPDPEFQTGAASAHTNSPVADYSYTAGSNSTKWALSPTVEYRLKKRLSVGLEFRTHQVQYQQVDQVRTGVLPAGVVSGSAGDTRPVTTITQTTMARYWELPLLAHYYRLRPAGLLSRTYVSGGLEYRHVSNIRTGTDFSYADGTTDYNEVPATPQHVNQVGVVVGIGLRFIDDFNIKVAPEARFVHWSGTTFQGPGYNSIGNQIEAGLGISF